MPVIEEFRIYYECLEQAEHYVAPAVRDNFTDTEVRLIKMKRPHSTSVIARSVATALAMKDPDILITAVIDDVEVGLIWMEISTAVETEDHELQRFDSIIAAGMQQLPFVKLQARRQSRSGHGGQTDFDRHMSYKLATQRLGIPCVEIEWPVSEDGLSAIRDPRFRACPASRERLAELIAEVCRIVLAGDNPADGLLGLVAADGWIGGQIQAYSEPLAPYGARNTTRLYEEASNWTLKFNRWGHAMDPERGMAWYYRQRIGFKLQGRLHDKEAKTAAEAYRAFCAATGLDRERRFHPDSFGPYDIDDLIAGARLNRPGIAIIWNCSSFTVCDIDGNPLLKLTWTAEPAAGFEVPFQTGDKTHLVAYDGVGEDEVTYAIANALYPANGFVVESVSYPGAQGDFALLEGSGRALRRTYIDVIAVKSSDGQTYLGLTESKGSNSPDKLRSDAEKVTSWRDDPERRRYLLDSMNLEATTVVLAAVAFPGSAPQPLALSTEPDYFVTVSGDEWVVWCPAAVVPEGISVLRQALPLPERWSY